MAFSETNLPPSDVVLDRVRTYLLDAGWISVASDPYLLRSRQGAIIRIPIGLSDSSKRLALMSLVDVVAQQEARSIPTGFLDQVLNGEDIVEFGVDVENVDSGRLPLSAGAAFYDTLYRFLGHALSAETNYRPAVSTITSSVREELGACSFGLSAKGSYLVNVHFRLDPSSEPLTRRVWHRVMNGLSTLPGDIASGSPRGLLALQNEGWNAQMCNALAKLIDTTQASKFRATAFENFFYRDQLTRVPTSVVFDARAAAQLLDRASVELSGLMEEQEITIRGPVYQLRNNEILHSDEANNVRVLWLSQSGAEIKVTVTLTADGYSKAVSAHSASQAIGFHGFLKRRGRAWVMEYPSVEDISH